MNGSPEKTNRRWPVSGKELVAAAMEEHKEIWGRVWSSVLLLPAAHSISRGSAATALLRGRRSTAAGETKCRDG